MQMYSIPEISGSSQYHTQKTLSQPVVFKGIGLHSGRNVTMTLIPAGVHEGIYFVRTDVSPMTRIDALWSNVIDTKMCTKIADTNGFSVGTIEHLMAALAGMEIDNLRIEIDGPEVPVMDGSSSPFVKKMRQVGLEHQKAYRRYLKIMKEIIVEHDDVYLKISPADHFSVSFNYNIQRLRKDISIGIQDLEIVVDAVTFEEIASARTFGFFEEVEYLKTKGLALGGSLENAIVFKEGKVLNPEGLRAKDELVRHKILDLVGDLSLAGPILGKIEGYSSGHTTNNLLLRAIFSNPQHYTWVYKNNDPLIAVSYTPSPRPVYQTRAC